MMIFITSCYNDATNNSSENNYTDNDKVAPIRYS